MLFFTQVCCLPGAWFKSAALWVSPEAVLFSFFFFSSSPILLRTGALIVRYQRKANPVDAGPARPRVCRSVAGLHSLFRVVLCSDE